MKKPATLQLTGKICFLFLLLAVMATTLQAQTTYTWTNSTGNYDWQNTANWTPVRATPANNDILVFNSGSATEQVRFTPVAETIGQLVVLNNTSLNFSVPFPLGTGGLHTLTISGLSGDDFEIAAGSSISFMNTGFGGDKVHVFTASGATARVFGSLGFLVPGYTMDAADAAGISFESGSVCSIGMAGSVPSNVFTSSGIPNAVVFKNGSTFNQTTGDVPFGLGAPASKIVFEPNSNFIAGQRANFTTNTFNGRNFGNLFLGMSASFSSTTYIGDLPLTVHNLNSSYLNTYSFNLTGGINITGDLTVTGTLQFNPSLPSVISFAGTTLQNIFIANNSSYTGVVNFGPEAKVKINNPAGVTVAEGAVGAETYHGDITLHNELDLTAGVFTFQEPAVLTLSSTASVVNASAAGYVDGTVKKEGNTAFTFPVGKSSTGYAPIAISAPANSTDAFTAVYKRTAAQAISTSYAAGLHHVSNADYWMLERTAGSAIVDVTAFWTPQSSANGSPGYINNLSSLKLAHYNSGVTMWDTYGGTVNPGSTVSAGSITWPGVNNFSPFALSSIDNSNLLSGASGGPLAVSINYLYGAKQNGSNILHWQVSCFDVTGVTIALQKRNGNTGFTDINIINATALRCLQPFNYTDNNPAAVADYYRLKITDANGKISYSNTIVMLNANEGFDVMNIAPSLVNTVAVINMSAAQKTKLMIAVINGAGKTVQQHAYNAIAGSSQFLLNAAYLPAGIYYVKIIPENGESKTLKFVKQ